MADFNNPVLRGRTGVEAGAIDAGLRSYMLRVYNYMLVGLVITGLASYGFFLASVTTDASQSHLVLTSFGQLIYGSPLKWLVMLAPLAVVMFISFRIQHLSVTGALTAFLIYSGLVGISLGTIFIVYAAASVAQVFFVTAAAFGGLSLFGYTTQRDLSGFGSFLIMGVFGLIIASLVNIFFHSPMMTWVISVLGVGIFAGLTAYDTQKIKEMYYAGDDGTLIGKKAIMGALSLYLDFINMFLFLLQLMGNRR